MHDVNLENDNLIFSSKTSINKNNTHNNFEYKKQKLSKDNTFLKKIQYVNINGCPNNNNKMKLTRDACIYKTSTRYDQNKSQFFYFDSLLDDCIQRYNKYKIYLEKKKKLGLKNKKLVIIDNYLGDIYYWYSAIVEYEINLYYNKKEFTNSKFENYQNLLAKY